MDIKQWRVPRKGQAPANIVSATINPGDKGIWVTCNMHKEGKCTAEARDIFNEVSTFSWVYPEYTDASPVLITFRPSMQERSMRITVTIVRVQATKSRSLLVSLISSKKSARKLPESKRPGRMHCSCQSRLTFNAVASYLDRMRRRG